MVKLACVKIGMHLLHEIQDNSNFECWPVTGLPLTHALFVACF